MLAFAALKDSWDRGRVALLLFAALSLAVLGACEADTAPPGGPAAAVAEPGNDDPGNGDPGAEPPVADGRPYVAKARVTHLTATAVAPDGVAHVHYPVDVTIGATAEADAPLDLPVLVGLYEKGGGQFCLLGLIDVPVGRAEPVTVAKRFYVPPTCLGGEGEAPVAGVERTMNLYTLVDPYDALAQDVEDVQSNGVVYTSEAVEGGDEAVLACSDGAGTAGCVVDLVVADSVGVDVDLVDLALDSSVVVLRTCAQAGDSAEFRCAEADGSFDDQRADVDVRVQLDAYGLPDAEPDLVTEVNALGDHDLRLSFAIRPSDGGDAWLPLYLHRRGVAERDETVFVESSIVPQGPHFYSHALRFSGCSDGECAEPSAYRRMVDGAWRDDVAFDVRACIDTEAEGPGLNDNNCRTVKLLVLREDPGAEPLAGYPPRSGVVECDPRWKACWSKVLGSEFALGSRSTIFVSFQYGTATRLDTDGGRTKNGAYLYGALFNYRKDILEAWGHAGVYTTPVAYREDADAPSSCACPELQALRQAFTGDDFMDDCIEECTTTRLRCDRRTSQAARDRCTRTCTTMCENQKKKQCIVAQGASAGYCRGGDCRSSNDCGPNQACINRQCRSTCTPNSFGTNQWVCQSGRRDLPDEQCIEIPYGGSTRHICATPCAAGDEANVCSGIGEYYEATCQCLAYYTLGLRVFGNDVWSREAAGGLPIWTKRISTAKGWGHEFYFAVGPIPVVIGYRLSGEGGLDLTLGVYLARGANYDMPVNYCATGKETNRCVTEGESVTPDDPSLPGYQNCGCDPQCRYFGDCCPDYDWVCEYGFPVPGTVNTRDFSVCGSEGGGANARCKKELDGANYTMALAAEVVPWVRFGASLWGGVDLLIVRAIVKGDFVLADISLPIVPALRLGLWGSPVAVYQMKLMGSFSVRLALGMLSGVVRIVAEHRYIRWCSWRGCAGPRWARFCWSVPYPCGFGWREFWSMKIAEWDGLRWVWPLFDAVSVKTWDLGNSDSPFAPGPD